MKNEYGCFATMEQNVELRSAIMSQRRAQIQTWIPTEIWQHINEFLLAVPAPKTPEPPKPMTTKLPKQSAPMNPISVREVLNSPMSNARIYYMDPVDCMAEFYKKLHAGAQRVGNIGKKLCEMLKKFEPWSDVTLVIDRQWQNYELWIKMELGRGNIAVQMPVMSVETNSDQFADAIYYGYRMDHRPPEYLRRDILGAVIGIFRST